MVFGILAEFVLRFKGVPPFTCLDYKSAHNTQQNEKSKYYDANFMDFIKHLPQETWVNQTIFWDFRLSILLDRSYSCLIGK